MPNLYDKTFFLHVAVCAVLVIGFVLFLRRWRTVENTEDAKANNIANNLIRCIRDCRTLKEVDFYHNEAGQFYEDWFEILGYDKSIRLYDRISDAAIQQKKILTRDRVSS